MPKPKTLFGIFRPEGEKTMAQQGTHCQYCGKYIRPDSPQRLCHAGYELLCKRCEKEINEPSTQDR